MKELLQLLFYVHAGKKAGTAHRNKYVDITFIVLLPTRHAAEQSQLPDAILVGKLLLVSSQTVDDFLSGFPYLTLLLTGTKIRISR